MISAVDMNEQIAPATSEMASQEESRTGSPMQSMPWKVVNRVPIVSLAGIYFVLLNYDIM